MRILFLLCLFPLVLLATTAADAYKKAERLEKEGNIQEAMLWYKKAATLSIESQTKTKQTALSESLQEAPVFVQDQLKRYHDTQHLYTSYFDTYEDKESSETLTQMLSGAFGVLPYKTNYLLPMTYDGVAHEGREQAETKFQISFKKELLHNVLGFDETLAVGYTQKSWWQTTQDSTPFRETNYLPEIFIYAPHKDKESPLKGYQAGLLHESNGRDGTNSRSWNRLYLTTYFQLGGVFIAPRAWYRIPEGTKTSPSDTNGDDNPDIHNYLGYGDLSFMYPWHKHLFKATLRNNLRFDEDNRGAFEFEWTFPLGSSGVFGYLQYFTGYGESLIDYDQRSDRIGLGFALSR